MEEDDEFGDLYTDVLISFPISSAPPPPQPPPPSSTATATSSLIITPPNDPPIHINNSGSAATTTTATALNIDTAPASDAVFSPGFGPSSAQQQHGGGGGGGGGGDWDNESDSDSEDDLQIVLNDNTNNLMDPNPMIIRDDDDDDEEDDGLIIVADHSQQQQQPKPGSEEPDCVHDGGEGKDGDLGVSTSVAPAISAAHKFGNYGFPPFHSQFKYVRPGAQPLPAGPGGAPGQVHPPINMTNMAGRGRGDWRPSGMKAPMQKGFHPGFWGNNAPGRGLDFTLPSHKSIFDVDIDSFEEKPWKYTGVDVSDFFNFNLNEESWKEYCKRLEQLRLESTMQSKIRVYESGHAEQEYDPDMPPELAAAAGIQDSFTENLDIAKADGLGDPAKGSSRIRSPLPTGRAIQVETGYGERLPSVDTRPPRFRDSDAVIEIVLQDSVDDGSPENDAIEHFDDDHDREDDQVDVVDEDGLQDDNEVFDRYPRESDAAKADLARKRSPVVVSPDTDAHDEEGDGSSPQRAISEDHPGSGNHAPSENIGSPSEERWTKTTASKRPPHTSSGESSLHKKSLDYQREDSIDSVEQKHFQESSQLSAEDAQASLDGKAATDDDFPSEVNSSKGGDVYVVGSTDKTKNKHRHQSSKERRMDYRVEPSTNKDNDDGGKVKASKSNENSKAAGSSRDKQKWRDGIDEEVVQNGHFNSTGEFKRRHGEVGHDSRRRDHDSRMELERNHFSAKGREDYYSHKDWDPYAASQLHVKPEVVDRRDRDSSEVSWQRRDEDHLGRRIRAVDGRKQERADDMLSRHRSKGREINRSEDEYLASRKLFDNGNWRGYHGKDPGLHYREKDDGLKSWHEILDDYHGKRRREDEHPRRDNVDKKEILLGQKESSTRGKRERDGFLDHRKRDDPPRSRDKSDDHYPLRLKDEVWVQREMIDQQRDRDEWYRATSSYEGNLSRREREDGRAPIRSNRGIEEKLWVGHSCGKEEYKGPEKDAGRHSEHPKKRKRMEEESSLQHQGSEDVYAHGNQFVSDGRRPRQERTAARNERTLNTSDSQKFHEKNNKDNFKKARKSEGHSPSAPSKRHRVEKGISNNVADVKNVSVAEHDTSSRKLTREGREDVSSDYEQHDSKRGRSKLERWTSHKDGEYDVNSTSSAPTKIKDTGKNRIAGSGPSAGVRDESPKNAGADVPDQTSGACRESGGSEGKDVDSKPADDRHLDTVEKLKRRSERFKLPLASEEPQTVKKTENETLPPSQSETPANPEVKQERPPRKRRWISS